MATALFDEIRIFNGSDELTTIFRDLINNDFDEAIKSLNHRYLQFPSLFILNTEISSEVYERLNTRNKYALDFINQVLSEEEGPDSERILSESTQQSFEAYKWILESGFSEDGLSEAYDEVLDKAAIVLCKVYNDQSCLRIMEALIFDRHRKGAYIYDLTWAYFESLNPQNINFLVDRLRSANPKDVELARKFLNFVPDINSRDEDSRKLYHRALKWLSQNQNFIYYTGVTNNQTSNPSRYAVSLEAKYLQKPACSVMQEQSRNLNKEEASYLNNFINLNEDTRLLLSKCSDMLYHINKYKWSKWLQSPVEKQIEIAERMVGQND